MTMTPGSVRVPPPLGGISATKSGKFLTLEAGRGLAALIVLVRHACVHAFEGPQPVLLLPLPSATAVMFFFVLSGFVMRRSAKAKSSSPAGALRFLAERAARIYPVYWVVLGATLLSWPFLFRADSVVSWLLLQPMPLPLAEFLPRLIVPQAWTLHWEVFFYLMFAIALALGSRWTFLLLWLGSILIRPLFPIDSLSTSLQTIIALVSDPLGLLFLTGVAVADISAATDFTRRSSWLLLAVAVAFTSYGIWQGSLGLFLPVTQADTIVNCLGLGSLVLALVNLERNGAIRLGRMAALLGRLSYPLYISHWLFMELLFKVMWLQGIVILPWPNAALLIATSIIGGTVVFFAVDAPVQKLISWLKKLWRDVATPAHSSHTL